MIYIQDMSIEKPLSSFLDNRSWRGSVLEQISEESKGTCYLIPIETFYHSPPSAVWRVASVYWHPDDELVTRFVAHGPTGDLRHVAWGVHYDSIPPDRKDIGGKYEYPPLHGTDYLLSVDGEMMTPNPGGYTVTVLDEKLPSESFAFGMSLHGRQHRCLVIHFRLFLEENGT